MKLFFQALVAAAAACSAITVSTAATFNCDINRSNTPNHTGTGVAPDPGTVWNSLVPPSAVTYTKPDLSDSNGNSSAIAVTISRSNGQNIKVWDDAAVSTGNPNPPDLMREYLYQGPYTVTLTNLTPGTYTLYVFAHGNNTGQNSTITLDASNGGASGTTTDTGAYRDILQAVAAGNTYLAQTGPVGAAGIFTFTTSSHLNGFQLYQHPVNPTLPDGYGSAATGGAGGPIYTVTNSAQLLARATSVETCTINISGTINVTGGAGGDGKSVRLLSNKTIQGLDANSTVIGCLDLSGVNNVIIRNLNITHPGSIIDPATGKYADGGDGITVWAATNVHISHCTIYDCADGGCDITRGSENITVSWCRFYYTAAALTHRFPMILGNTDESEYHVTLHHNWFGERCDQRMPSGSYSKAHIYNNYFSCVGNYYCTDVRTGGEFLVENNYYDGVRNPCGKQSGGKMFLSGNIFDSCIGNPGGWDSTAGAVTGNDSIFSPPYGYTLDPAADVPAIVVAGAGNVATSPAPASITLSDLFHTYDGTPKAASVTTTPPDIAVDVTYDGSPIPPSAAGTYTVAATIADSGYTGGASGTLTIAKSTATVTISQLQQIEDGSPKSVIVVTDPSGLTVDVTYNGSAVAPSAPGTYSVEAAVNDANHNGSASGTLTVDASNSWNAWKQTRFTPLEIEADQAEQSADPDHDSLANLAEYALGSDPKNFTPPLQSKLEDGVLFLIFSRPAALPDVLYAAETSTDLIVWQPANMEVIVPGDPQTVRVSVPIADSPPFSHMLRLRFETP